MAVRISGAGSISGLTDWEATSVTHPNSGDTNITLVDDGSVAFDSIPADIQSAIDAAGNAGIGSNVVQTVKTDRFTTSSSTYQDVTGFTATITPTSATSRILVVADVKMGTSADGGVATGRLLRGTTPIYVSANSITGHQTRSQNHAQSINASGNVFLDDPETTSPVTYKWQIRVTSNNAIFNGGRNTDNTTASSLTLIEVAP